MQMTPPLHRKQRGSEEPLDEKEESEKAGLKLNIQTSNIMAFGPITSWEIDGENVETVSDFLFLGSKITVDSDCSHGIKRCLLLGRIAMTDLDSVLKSGDITFPTKVHLVIHPERQYANMNQRPIGVHINNFSLKASG